MIAILRLRPGCFFTFRDHHSYSAISSLIKQIKSIEGESQIVIEHTGRYYESLTHVLSLVNLFITAVNPKLIKDFGDSSLRKVESDKADAVPQLMAEIGDATRFSNKGAIIAFAGVDPGVNQSETYEQRSVHASKRGSSNLRKTLFQVMDTLIKNKPQDDAINQIMDKKRVKGKPCYVFMTADANKFLCIFFLHKSFEIISFSILTFYLQTTNLPSAIL